jgi:hypothetical protein
MAVELQVAALAELEDMDCMAVEWHFAARRLVEE